METMFIGTWWALVPPLLAIILALVTKEVYSSLFIGVAAGALLYAGFRPWDSFVAFFDIMKNSINLNILIFDVLLGMIIVLLSKSGGSAAYGDWAGKKIKSKRSALLATTGLGILIFVDDYFNCLTVGSVMRPVTDRFKVSRAKLAYIIDATAAPVCIIAPVSSWAAAVNSYVPADAGISGFQLFLRMIPYNLYAILTIVMVLYISITGFDFGLMKKHEENAAKGDLFTSGAEEFEQVKKEEISSRGRVTDLILPVLVLIFSAIGAMIYTGFLGGATDIITAFANCDAETSLIFATLLTVFFMLVLYVPRRIITFKSYMDSLVDGFKMMIPAVTILVFAWTLKGMGDALQIGDFVGNLVKSDTSASVIIPAIMYVIAVFLSFSTGTSWGTFAILVPIATAMFPGGNNLEMMIISVAAVLAGAVCGDHISPISDTTVMSSAGAQSNHINHVTTQMQYAAIVAFICILGYIIAGLVQIWWIALGLSLAILLVVLTFMRKYGEGKTKKVESDD
ncbi:Na+/H+ antiporter NhaC family protein [Clostridium sp. C105KSO13]|uniref:Na+/H+ antiporter NhaC family protein n=1 Tax=Clostridium sp. C105KSO13 TaxID=1776045 RepID=UPI000740774C|nr:Na+/H+ antiporter NhaC family protein [Clostridium sp. C105KSO13]CUX31324.1 Malate-2H(+)/Na(+)-lactate antiporter [Clostridium sp. C105KSO13]